MPAPATPGFAGTTPPALPQAFSNGVPRVLPGTRPPVATRAADAGVTAPAFATDLARLIATLAGSGEGAEDVSESPSPFRDPAMTETLRDPADAVSALWMQLGLAAAPPAHASHDASAATVAPGTDLPAPAAPAPSASPAAAAAAPVVAAASTSATGTGTGLDPSARAVDAGGADDLSAWLATDAPAALAADPSNPDALRPKADSARMDGPQVSPAGLGGLLHAPAGERVPSTPVVAPAIVDLRHAQAPQQIAESVVWHVAQHGGGEVRIRLNPEDLGPLDVQLKLDGDKVQVRFDTADASVRDTVQTSLPNLASLLSARGLQLDQAQVFSQSRGQQPLPQAPADPGRETHGESASDSDAASRAPRLTLRRGLIDDYV